MGVSEQFLGLKDQIASYTGKKILDVQQEARLLQSVPPTGLDSVSDAVSGAQAKATQLEAEELLGD